MRRALLSVLVISFVLAGAAGFSSADQAEQAASELRADWIAVQSLPSDAVKATVVDKLRYRARSLARQYPGNADVQALAAAVVSSQRRPAHRPAWRG